MRGSGWWTRAAVLVVLLAAGTACSNNSAEDEMRAEMREAGLSDASIDCVFEAYDDAGLDLASFDEATLPPSPAADACFGQVFEEMFTEGFAETLTEGLVEAFEEGFSGLETGDLEWTPTAAASEEDLADLAKACRSGDNTACDDLWLASPIGSPEEDLAESCGGRSPEPRMGSCEFWAD